MKMFHGVVERASGPNRVKIGPHTFSRKLHWSLTVWPSDELRHGTEALYLVKAGWWFLMNGPAKLANCDAFQQAYRKGKMRIVRGSDADIMSDDCHRWIFYDAVQQTAKAGAGIMIDTVDLGGRCLGSRRVPAGGHHSAAGA